MQLIISTPPFAPDPLRPAQADAPLFDESPNEAGDEAQASHEVRQWRVDNGVQVQRLDRALAAGVSEFSRSYLQQCIESGDVLLDGVVALKAAQRVRAGQRIGITLRPTPQSRAFVPQDLAVHTVYADEHLRVVHKPAGCVVHPAPGNWQGTLLNGLLFADPSVQDLPRAGIVHRLDKDTSGLMVVARTRQAMDALVRMIAAREVSRQYMAIGQRAWRGAATRVVDAAVGRDPHQRLRMAVVDLALHAGKTARTTFDCVDTTDEACLVRCTLHTGRTHQIRVHMAHLQHPLLGDGLYGGPQAAGMVRQALHAWRLAFAHPITGQAMAWELPLPPDMVQAMQTLGLRYNAQPRDPVPL